MKPIFQSLLMLALFVSSAFAQIGQSVKLSYINTPSHLVFSQSKPSTLRPNSVDVGLVIRDRFTSQYESISNAQYDFETRRGRSVFRTITASGTAEGTSFLIGRDLVLTNKHLLTTKLPTSPTDCGRFTIEINQTHERVACKKVEYCHPQQDFCVVRMNPVSANIRPLYLQTQISKDSFEEESILFIIGNAKGLGLQAASERGGVALFSPILYHCVTAYPGNSGSPLLNDSGEVMGIHYAYYGAGTRVTCPHGRTTGLAIASSFIVETLKAQRPDLATELVE